MADTTKPRGAGGKFISEEMATNITTEDIPDLVHKSSSMTGALKDLKEQKEEEELEKPLVSVSVNNPITWLLKVINNLKKKQTTTFTFRLGIPLIALPIFIACFAGLFFGLGKITTKSKEKVESIQISRAGLLKITKENAKSVSYLVFPSGEAIKLLVPETLTLDSLNGRRVLVSGLFTQESATLKVENVADMELLPESPKPIPSPLVSETPTPVSVPLPSQEDLIQNFFNLITEGKIPEAVSMLSAKSTDDDSKKQAWGVQFNAFQKIKVTSIEPAGENIYRVDFDVEMKPGTEDITPIPYYGWGNGASTRWVNLVKEGEIWKIDGIATGP